LGICTAGIVALVCCTTPAWAQEETPERPGTSAVGCQILTSEQIETYPSVSHALRGQVTGFKLFESSGQAGAGSSIALRGPSSLRGMAPLLFIDGVKISDAVGGDAQTISLLDQINPLDVLLIEIFRGSSATTMYGTDAANGIIRVYTKHGSAASDIIDDVKARCVP
jgi:outer membrane cobalamin receptor